MFAVSDPAKGKKGITAFLVPTDTPGFKVARLEKKLGLRASDTAQIVLENCRLTPDLHAGRRRARAIASRSAISRAAASASPPRPSAWRARPSRRRSPTPRSARPSAPPIINHQAVQFRLADMATQIEAARALTLAAAALRDAGQPCLKEASMAKLFASEMAERVCSDALQIHGGYGYLSDFPVERIYRDVRICQIYEGTSDIQRMVIGRALAQE